MFDENLTLRMTSAVEGSLFSQNDNVFMGVQFSAACFDLQVLERMQESDSAMFSTQAAALNPSKNRYRDILPCKYQLFFAFLMSLHMETRLKFSKTRIN